MLELRDSRTLDARSHNLNATCCLICFRLVLVSHRRTAAQSAQCIPEKDNKYEDDNITNFNEKLRISSPKPPYFKVVSSYAVIIVGFGGSLIKCKLRECQSILRSASSSVERTWLT